MCVRSFLFICFFFSFSSLYTCESSCKNKLVCLHFFLVLVLLLHLCFIFIFIHLFIFYYKPAIDRRFWLFLLTEKDYLKIHAEIYVYLRSLQKTSAKQLLLEKSYKNYFNALPDVIEELLILSLNVMKKESMNLPQMEIQVFRKN